MNREEREEKDLSILIFSRECGFSYHEYHDYIFDKNINSVCLIRNSIMIYYEYDLDSFEIESVLFAIKNIDELGSIEMIKLMNLFDQDIDIEIDFNIEKRTDDFFDYLKNN